jgi:hypothetical protein
MAKRPSLFASKQTEESGVSVSSTIAPSNDGLPVARPPSRAGKRVLSTYLDPLAWKQIRQLALDNGTTTQALGEEAVNLLFAKYGLNRSA